MSKAEHYLQDAKDLLTERGKQYDAQGGERSMGKTVHAFNVITGRDLTEKEGWFLLGLLKDVRLFTNPDKFHADSSKDGLAYRALMAEAFSNEEVQRVIGDIPNSPLLPS